jgi:hypothetical protein
MTNAPASFTVSCLYPVHKVTGRRGYLGKAGLQPTVARPKTSSRALHRCQDIFAEPVHLGFFVEDRV